MSDFVLNRIIHTLNEKNVSTSNATDIRETIDAIIEKNFDEIDCEELQWGYKHLFEQDYYRKGFINRMMHQYLEPMSEFEIFNEKALACANTFINQHNHDRTVLFRVLKIIFIRANLIVKEIECLLKNGFASASLARWRSLYEYSIYALFILKHGEESAKRFLDYTDIETVFELDSYQKYCDVLGLKKIPSRTIKRIEKDREKLKNKYGEDFLKRNGWAANIIKVGKRNTVPFEEIVKETDQEDIMGYYNWSCQAIHANPKNIFTNLGNIYGIKVEDDKILGNASNIGFADPAQLCMYSFLTIFEALISLYPTSELLLEIIYMRKKIMQTTKKFVSIEKEICKQEKNK